MYHRHFGLVRAPFTIAPDPRFLYMSERHREALAHLQWGLERDGAFVLLTGEVGTGKTTLSRLLLDRLPEDTDVAFVIHPRVTVTELLATICEELHDPPTDGERASVGRLVDRIHHRLLEAHARGRRTVLVIDEAQNLATDVLEQIRLLTNLETSERKLLQVILLGQPELDALLRQPALRQLAQRITARYHLEPLDREELAALVEHRLAVAGALTHPFTEGALRALHRESGGVPRVANVIADRAMLGAYALGTLRIPPRIVRRAAREIRGEREPPPQALRWGAGALAAGLLAVVAVGIAGWIPGVRSPFLQAAPETVGTAAPPAEVEFPAASGVVLRPDPAPGPEPGPGEGPARAPAAASESGAAPRAAPPSRARAEEAADGPAAPGRAAEPLADLWARAPERTLRDAFEAVLGAWFTPLTLEPGADPCEAVQRVGLRCLDYRGGWPALLALDRPAVLEVEGGGAERRSVALLDAGAGAVRVAGGTFEQVLPRSALNRHWTGRATVLWQMPPGYEAPLEPGDRGEAVAWLRRQLAALDGEGAESDDPERFDPELARRLRAFQAARGLEPDAVAGPLTWIHLNSAGGGPVPALAGDPTLGAAAALGELP
ncbi:MAG: AAA family ATPase [Pseudomonadales bacterium]|nr:AAA family ATPase [Pseudomonadales bacterium]